MALDAEDLARLRRIESGLTRADPSLAQQFQAWQPSSDGRALLPGWSAIPPWVLFVFIVAFCTWMVSPVLGVLVVVAGGIARQWARGARPAAAPRRRDPGGGRVFRWPDHRG
jgi:Protein of unknown function (DUF3040)